MLPPSVIFYFSKGAKSRRRIIRIMHMKERHGKPVFLNEIAKELGISHVAARKHLDLLVDEGYVEKINPGGKPVYLKLTKKGIDVIEKLLEQ